MAIYNKTICEVSIQILVNELLTFIGFYTLFDIQNSHFETVLQSMLQYEDDPPPFLILLALHQINSESQNYSIMDFMVGWWNWGKDDNIHYIWNIKCTSI